MGHRRDVSRGYRHGFREYAQDKHIKTASTIYNTDCIMTLLTFLTYATSLFLSKVLIAPQSGAMTTRRKSWKFSRNIMSK